MAINFSLMKQGRVKRRIKELYLGPFQESVMKVLEKIVDAPNYFLKRFIIVVWQDRKYACQILVGTLFLS